MPEVNRKGKQKPRRRGSVVSVVQARNPNSSQIRESLVEHAVNPEKERPYPPTFIEGIKEVLDAGGVNRRELKNLFRVRSPQKQPATRKLKRHFVR